LNEVVLLGGVSFSTLGGVVSFGPPVGATISAQDEIVKKVKPVSNVLSFIEIKGIEGFDNNL
jgi:hypothetical protein